MKKQKIDFDFSKWGQEGISVEYKGNRVQTLHQHPNENAYQYYYGVDCFNNFFVTYLSQLDLIMYQEIKPREIWVNEQEGGGFHYSKVFSSKEGAESQKLPFVIRTVKFREVLDDEQ